MTPTPEVHERLRRYLLGQLTHDAREELEQDVLSSDEVFQELLMLEDEMVDEYLSERLDDTDRAAFQQHFLATPERHEKLKFSRAFNRYVSAQNSVAQVERQSESARGFWSYTQGIFSAPVRIAVFAVLVVAVAFGVWRVFFHQSEVDKGLVALNAAYREQRPVEARISSLSYAPFSQTRGGPDAARVDALARDRAELTLNNAVNTRGDAAAHHALGEVYLANKRFDDAIAQFDLALKSDPKNARLYSDLGAAWLEKGKLDRDGPEPGNGMAGLGRSLENLNRSLELDPNLLEALFNRALCVQNLMQPREAEKEWQEYLKKDSTSSWAEEARRYLKLVSAKNSAAASPTEILNDFFNASMHQQNDRAWKIVSTNREMITGRMVAFQLARQYLAQTSPEDENKTRTAFTYAGGLENDKAGDPFVADLSGYYLTTTPEQRQLLRQAQTKLYSAYDLSLHAAYEKALPEFLDAQKIFFKAGDKLEGEIVDYWIAYCDSQADRIAASIVRLESLVEKCRRQHYEWCESQALCLLANSYDLLGQHSRSIRYDESALQLAGRLADTYNEQKILTQMAIEYTRVGRPERALTYLKKSLELADSNSPRQQWRNYAFGSQTFYSLKLYHAAEIYEQGALRLATEVLNSDSLAHLSTVHLGMIYAGMHRFEDARREVEESLRIAQAATEDPSAARMLSYSNIQLAHLNRQTGNCDMALQLYRRATGLSEKMEFDLDKYDAHKGQLLCYEQANDDRATEQELGYVIDLFERNRARILEKQNRDSFFDGEQSVYDIGIEYAFKRGARTRAFELSENSRARTLVDSLQLRGVVSNSGEQTDLVFSSVSRPLTLDSIQRSLPNGVQVVQYNVLRDRLLIWTISRDGFDVVDTPVKAEDLNNEIANYVTLLTANNSAQDVELRRQATALYRLLIAPIDSRIAASREICFIPDKSLFYLPFASLVSEVNDDYLVAHHAVFIAPSATVMILCSRAAEAKSSSKSESLVSIGNPSFDMTIYSDMPSLPEARREASEITGEYENHMLLTDSQANKESIMPLLHQANIIHFACHYLPDGASPLNSKLLLARSAKTDRSDDGTLSAGEILKWKIPQARLVVLSGCRTGLDRYFNGEGMVGLAETFIAAGAPLVVASGWSVDSEATGELMIRFHQHRKHDGLSTSSALRAAQLDLINAADGHYARPYYWAGFLPVGGYATY